MATFSERMKELRHINGITLERLAEILGTTKATLSRYENGLRIPNADFINQLAGFFNVSSDYLLGRTDIRFPLDKVANALTEEPELICLSKKLRRRKDLLDLIEQTKDMTPRDIQLIIKISKAIEEDRSENSFGNMNNF